MQDQNDTSNSGDTPDYGETFRATKQLYELTCPECGEMAEQTFFGDHHVCGECGNRWTGSEIENCVECGKPLGSSDAICHTCWSDRDND